MDRAGGESKYARRSSRRGATRTHSARAERCKREREAESGATVAVVVTRYGYGESDAQEKRGCCQPEERHEQGGDVLENHTHDPWIIASHDLLFDCSASRKCVRAPGVMFPGTPAAPAMLATASGACGCGSFAGWRCATSAPGIAGCSFAPS